MKIFSIIIIVGICISVIFPTEISFTQEDTEEQRLKALYPANSFKYRGVVSIDIGDGDRNHELICDFGSRGVYFYDTSRGWHRISSDNPEWIIGVQFGFSDYEILADFGTMGLWLWNYTGLPGTWTLLSPDDAQNAIALDDDMDGQDEIQVDFGNLGLWRYDDDTGWWTVLTADNPTGPVEISDYWPTGIEEGNWAFGPYGTWSVYWNRFSHIPYWDFLTPDSADDDNVAGDVGVGSSADEVAFDFSTLGLWVYQWDSYQKWHIISPDSPKDIRAVRFVGDPFYEFVVQFEGVPGLWMWDYSGWPGTWTLLTDDNPTGDEAFCESFDPDGLWEASGDEEVAVDFGSNLGLWLYDNNVVIKWTQINPDSPTFMVRSDLKGYGADTCLICDFGTAGLWYYDGNRSKWIKISSNSPDPN